MVAALGLVGCRGAADSETGAESTGISADRVVLGFTEPYTGALAGNGLPLRDGIRAYVASVNAEGGIDGRQIVLKDYDNGYDPARTVDAARRLVEQDKVFAVFGAIGTPTNIAMRDYLVQREVPNLFMGTGDESALGDGELATSALASYTDEARVYTTALLKKKPDARIAVIYQNDDLGQSHLSSIEETVEGTDAEVVAKESYEASDPSVAAQMSQLAESDADSLIVVATGKSASQVFSTLGSLSWKPDFVAANSTASTIPGLRAAGFDNAQGLLSTLYLKDPSDPQWQGDEGLVRYREVIEEYAPSADPSDYYTAAGYTYAQMVVAALKEMDEPTREGVMEAARNLPTTELDMLIPGVTISTNPEDLHAVSALQPVVFKGSSWTLDGEPVVID